VQNVERLEPVLRPNPRGPVTDVRHHGRTLNGTIFRIDPRISDLEEAADVIGVGVDEVAPKIEYVTVASTRACAGCHITLLMTLARMSGFVGRLGRHTALWHVAQSDARHRELGPLGLSSLLKVLSWGLTSRAKWNRRKDCASRRTLTARRPGIGSVGIRAASLDRGETVVAVLMITQIVLDKLIRKMRYLGN
jgi:hypothetical protein